MTKSITGYPLALKTASTLKLFWALGLTSFSRNIANTLQIPGWLPLAYPALYLPTLPNFSKGIKLDGAHCQNIQLA